MKQVVERIGEGCVRVAEVPAPGPRPGRLLIASEASLISAGTERAILAAARESLLAKARRQPGKARRALGRLREDGVLATVEAVRRRFDRTLALGYCNVGRVVAIGAGVEGFAVGARVASNGPHAEVVSVPARLAAPVPEGVAPDAAAFTVLGAIALHGIRLAAPSLGECFAVSGLGLVGLLAVQLLRAQGCRVLGLDLVPERLALAERFGAETVDLATVGDPEAAALAFSRGRGLDGVIVATSGSDAAPLHQAAAMARRRGRIVLVGVAEIAFEREVLYRKELSFQVSCSYGPGRYDPAYEEAGHDYPPAYVRWTEQRNFEAVLDALAAGRIETAPLVSHRFAIARAEAAYAVVTGETPSLGVLIDYPKAAEAVAETRVAMAAARRPGGARIAVVGAGAYATRILMPALVEAGAEIAVVATPGGLSAAEAARRFAAGAATTDVAAAIAEPDIDAVVIASRHDSHAEWVCAALAAGKAVFCEKPLAIDRAGLARIEAACGGSSPLLMVGFNRRFAPLTRRIKALLEALGVPRMMVMTVNAGPLPAEHWTRDPAVGGGRLIGEGCHFIDLLMHLAGGPMTALGALPLGGPDGAGGRDGATVTLAFADGSLGTLHYAPNGHPGEPKERLRVFAGGRSLALTDFRRLEGRGWPGLGGRLRRPDKGNAACVAAFVAALREGGPPPIPMAEILAASRATLEAAEKATGG